PAGARDRSRSLVARAARARTTADVARFLPSACVMTRRQHFMLLAAACVSLLACGDDRSAARGAAGGAADGPAAVVCDAPDVRALVTELGARLRDVSLLAPDAGARIREVYGELVAPELLAAWAADPAS